MLRDAACCGRFDVAVSPSCSRILCQAASRLSTPRISDTHRSQNHHVLISSVFLPGVYSDVLITGGRNVEGSRTNQFCERAILDLHAFYIVMCDIYMTTEERGGVTVLG